MLSGCGTPYLSRLEADSFQGSERHVALVGELGEPADDPATHTQNKEGLSGHVQRDSVGEEGVLPLTLWHWAPSKERTDPRRRGQNSSRRTSPPMPLASLHTRGQRENTD